jgi:hypothetical protein
VKRFPGENWNGHSSIFDRVIDNAAILVRDDSSAVAFLWTAKECGFACLYQIHDRQVRANIIAAIYRASLQLM